MFGHAKLRHTPPGFDEPYTTHWSGDGRLLLVRPPGSDGVRTYEYDPSSGELARIVAGDQVGNVVTFGKREALKCTSNMEYNLGDQIEFF